MPEPTIEFSSKELFLEINRKIDVLTEMSHSKADNARLDRVELEIRTQLTRLEKEMATSAAVQANEDRLNDVQRNSRYQWMTISLSLVLGLGMMLVELLKVTK